MLGEFFKLCLFFLIKRYMLMPKKQFLGNAEKIYRKKVKNKTYNPVTQRWLLSTEYFLSVSCLCLNILWKYGFSGLMTCLHINVLWFMGPSPWWRTACWSFLYCLLMFPCWIVNAFNLFSHFGGKDDPGKQNLPSLLMERIGNKKFS